MSTPRALPRVGHIQFLNCLPLYWGLERIGALDRMELFPDTPDRLSDALIAGDLDVGPISLVEALRHADDLVLLPEAAVTAYGPVQSVCVVSTAPITELDGATVALGSTSRTSVELARLVLESRLGLSGLKYVTMPPDLDQMLEVADAAVAIGDVALRATLVDGPARGWVVTDLSQQWRDWTGLPMVFAVWAARREFAAGQPAVVAELRGAFAEALTAAADAPREVAQSAALQGDSRFSADQLAEYYRHLWFTLGPRECLGLQELAAMLDLRAAASRLLGSVPPPA